MAEDQNLKIEANFATGCCRSIVTKRYNNNTTATPTLFAIFGEVHPFNCQQHSNYLAIRGNFATNNKHIKCSCIINRLVTINDLDRKEMRGYIILINLLDVDVINSEIKVIQVIFMKNQIIRLSSFPLFFKYNWFITKISYTGI